MDEELFWHTMNPARLHTLYDAHFSPMQPQPEPEPAPQPKARKGSFAEFLMGGG